MIHYLVFVNEEEKVFHQFESAYLFTKKENIGDVLYINKDGKIHSVTIETINTHEIRNQVHYVRINAKFNKFFS